MEEKSISQMREELRDFYFKKVKPNLETLNKKRKKSRIDLVALVLILIGFAIFFSIGGLKINGVSLVILPVICLVVGAMVLMLNHKDEKNRVIQIDVNGEYEFKKMLMPEFLKIFGNLQWKDLGKSVKPVNMEKYKTSNLLSSFLVGAFGDRIWGAYRGVKFDILELDTSKTSLQSFINTLMILPFVFGCGCGLFGLGFVILSLFLSWLSDILNNGAIYVLFLLIYLLGIPLFVIFKYISQSGFRGVFVEFDMNKNFEGHTFILERALTNRGIKFERAKFEDVKLEDPSFMQKYEVYSDNQVEARYVLTTAFIERFLNMKMAFKAKYIRASFKDGKIIIAIDAGRDLFQMANLNKDTDANTFTELFDEILSVLELINTLKLNQRIGL